MSHFISLLFKTVKCSIIRFATLFTRDSNTYADPYASGFDGDTRTCDSAVLTSTVTGQAVRPSGDAVMVWPMYNEAALMAAVTAAPTTVYFDVQLSFYFYGGGIYAGNDCGVSINHASE